MKNDRNNASIILYFFFDIRKPASTLKNIIAIIKVSIELAKSLPATITPKRQARKG